MARFGKLNWAQKHCVSKAGMFMQRTAMLQAGSRVGVAVSGGVDSMTLLKVLTIRRRILPFPVELMALHVNPGFDSGSHAPIVDFCREHGIAAHFEVGNYGPRAFTAENRTSSPCFFCSMMRRTRLFELCERFGLTHLALGHHADDLMETFFLNLLQGGRVDGMKGRDYFFRGRLMMVRPLLMVEKSVIRRAARAWGLPIVHNPCPESGQSRRSEVAEWLKELWAKQPGYRTNAYAALQRWQLKQDVDASLKDQPSQEPADGIILGANTADNPDMEA